MTNENRQFGNLLVLQAAYHSPLLRPMIPEGCLEMLLSKTIHWYDTLAGISPPLARDREILGRSAERGGIRIGVQGELGAGRGGQVEVGVGMGREGH